MFKNRSKKYPWAKYYPDGQINLEYPDCSLYEELLKSANNILSVIVKLGFRL